MMRTVPASQPRHIWLCADDYLLPGALAAVAAAAALVKRVDLRDRRAGIIISGGNVDLKAAAQLFA